LSPATFQLDTLAPEPPVSNSLLATNSLWNLMGNVLPLLGAVVAIPKLQRALGTDDFGILLLAWATAGYFSLFDFGLGRAITKLVAEKLASGRRQDIPDIFWTSTWAMAMFGVCGALLAAALSHAMLLRLLNVPPSLHGEALQTFYLLAFAIPWLVLSTGFRGVLEAQQRFDLANAVRLPMGLLVYVGPLVVLPFSRSVAAVTALIVLVRIVGCLAFLGLCMSTMQDLRRVRLPRRKTLRPLFSFGMWMTISNFISPILVTFDRFVIGAVLSLAAVAYYSTPFEVVTKLLIIAGAVMGVMFPAFSSTFAQDPRRTTQLLVGSFKYVLLGMFPIIFMTVLFSFDGLQLWLGANFAVKSYRVLQWLAVGVLFNCVAQVPFSAIQGTGRPDLTAKLHLLELPVYLALLWVLLKRAGIEGAAVASAARMALDCLALTVLAFKLLPNGRRPMRKLLMLLCAAVLLCMAAFLPTSFPSKLGWLAVATVAGATLTFRYVLEGHEVARIKHALGLLASL